jgi:GH25 family lysozyme M1 (1,4-beta-N-acetylmuramidase)
MGLKNITSVSLKANLSSSSRVIILIDLAGQKPIYYISQNFMVSTRIKKSISKFGDDTLF